MYIHMYIYSMHIYIYTYITYNTDIYVFHIPVTTNTYGDDQNYVTIGYPIIIFILLELFIVHLLLSKVERLLCDCFVLPFQVLNLHE